MLLLVTSSFNYLQELKNLKYRQCTEGKKKLPDFWINFAKSITVYFLSVLNFTVKTKFYGTDSVPVRAPYITGLIPVRAPYITAVRFLCGERVEVKINQVI